MKEIVATVVKHTGSHYWLSELPLWAPFPAVMRGKVRLQASSATNPVAVGDRVRCEMPDATIVEVLPRNNAIIRKSTNLSRQTHIIAANVDRAFIVVTLVFPEVKLPFLDRVLVSCGVYGVPVTILLNKVDMLADVPEMLEYKEHFRSIYEGAGYPVMELSARTGEGVDELRELVSSGGTFILSGVSGVGKSSIIKALDPSLNPKTARISTAHLQGCHTTTFYEMYPLACGGFIIDSPGIRSFGLVDLEPGEISPYFPEMLRVMDDCRFVPCTHTHEPGCAVKAAVDSGGISPERYASYLGMLEENDKYRKNH